MFQTTVCLQRVEKLVLLYVATAACCFQDAMLESVVIPSEISQVVNPAKFLDDNLQIDSEVFPKRAWNSNLNMWGKRGWNNLHSGWGKRDPGPLILDEEYNSFMPAIAEKRAWQNLQGGWGKRFVPSDDDLSLKQIEAAMDENQTDDVNNGDDLELFVPIEGDLDEHHFDKRNWNKFTDGWGKRSNQNKWNKFRGSWGKREPAWNNLKGLWGKRSVSE